MEGNDFDYEPAEIESIDDFPNQENNNKPNIPIKKEDKSYDDLLNYDNEPRIYLTKDQPRITPPINNDHIDPQVNTVKQYTYFDEEDNKDPPKKKAPVYHFDIDDLLDDDKDKNQGNLIIPPKNLIQQDNHIRVKEQDDSYNDPNLFDEEIDDNNKGNQSKEEKTDNNNLNMKKNENHEPLFLTEKETPFQPVSKPKNGNDMNYDDLLNNNTFNKRKTNTQNNSVQVNPVPVKNQEQENYDFPEYNNEEEDYLKELLDNREEIENTPVIPAKNNNKTEQILFKNNSKTKIDVANKENHNYQPMNYSLLRSSKVMLSHFEQAEVSYAQLKIGIDKLINTSVPKTNKNDLSNQNSKMLQYLSSLNIIVKDLTDHTRVPIKKPQLPKKESLGKTNINNDKILERYKNEYIKLKTRLTQLSEPSYDAKVSEELNEIKTQIAYYEKENKQLKNTQRLSERILEKQSRGIDTTMSKLKMIEMDYDALKYQYETLQGKTEKNKQTVKENDIKLKELNDWKGRLEQQAKDMYGLTEFEDVAKEEMIEKAKKEKITKLKKKIDVIDGSMESHKRKYEVEIAKNEKEIFQKEQDKLALLKTLKEKTIETENLAEMIKAIYAPTLLSQKNEREEIINNNLAKQEREENINNSLAKQEIKTPIMTPKQVVINEKPHQNYNSFNTSNINNNNNYSNSKASNDKNIGREYQNIPTKKIIQPEENMKNVHQPEPEKLLLNNNLPTKQPIKVIPIQNQDKNREPSYLPYIDPKNNAKQTFDLDNNDNSKSINNPSNNNSNSRRPNFAFGFKKNEINNSAVHVNDNIDNNQIQTKQKYDIQPRDKDNIEEILRKDEGEYENENRRREYPIKNEEQAKKNNEINNYQVPSYNNNDKRQSDQYDYQDNIDNQSSNSNNKQSIKQPLVNPVKEPSFLNDNNNNIEAMNTQAKRAIPSFLDEEIEEMHDTPNDLFKHEQKSSGLNEYTNLNPRAHINSKTIEKKPKEEEIESNPKPVFQSKMNDHEVVPDRKKMEKTKEEKESEDAYNQLFNAKAIAEATKKNNYDPFDDFADLEELNI